MAKKLDYAKQKRYENRESDRLDERAFVMDTLGAMWRIVYRRAGEDRFVCYGGDPIRKNAQDRARALSRQLGVKVLVYPPGAGGKAEVFEPVTAPETDPAKLREMAEARRRT